MKSLPLERKRVDRVLANVGQILTAVNELISVSIGKELRSAYKEMLKYAVGEWVDDFYSLMIRIEKEEKQHFITVHHMNASGDFYVLTSKKELCLPEIPSVKNALLSLTEVNRQEAELLAGFGMFCYDYETDELVLFDNRRLQRLSEDDDE